MSTDAALLRIRQTYGRTSREHEVACAYLARGRFADVIALAERARRA